MRSALPPPICAAATASIRHLKVSQVERQNHQDRVQRVKAELTAAKLPVMASDSHIVPVRTGDPAKCKAASDMLLAEYGIYIQPINYPTVARGTERLRITPSPCHDDIMIGQLVAALTDVWHQLGLPHESAACAAEKLPRKVVDGPLRCKGHRVLVHLLRCTAHKGRET
ncbi:5-aminolevulinate synthase (plasmid) [Sinorhizobium fredii CCBAU 83666]|nr:5-aminolevulinate synthase [Sinorhizobium fredii CCBAU 83666]